RRGRELGAADHAPAGGARADGRGRRPRRRRTGRRQSPRFMSWTYLELVLVSLAAMLSPTTLTFSVLSVVLSDKPLRTAFWFYLGALTATLAIGVIAAFVIGDIAAC